MNFIVPLLISAISAMMVNVSPTVYDVKASMLRHIVAFTENLLTDSEIRGSGAFRKCKFASSTNTLLEKSQVRSQVGDKINGKRAAVTPHEAFDQLERSTADVQQAPAEVKEKILTRGAGAHDMKTHRRYGDHIYGLRTALVAQSYIFTEPRESEWRRRVERKRGEEAHMRRFALAEVATSPPSELSPCNRGASKRQERRECSHKWVRKR
ncbi:hypothetical protein C8R45DRAFT_947161 [Mycena sanguinolenta]|nr:hypothetical protein C8R45DRAFT_947161 [Mycena sanguinolenta]